MTNPEQLRVRVFAGPNGSGKSTIINIVRNFVYEGQTVDFGLYVNADDIAKQLREKSFNFSDYGLNITDDNFRDIATKSGLINDKFPFEYFDSSYIFENNSVILKISKADERMAQIIADFLREKLLEKKVKFSFETVFSHESKIAFMKKCAEAGYKVYLYFVSTESPEINIYRVGVRKAKGGHFVPDDLVRSRYYRSLEYMYNAAQVCYQAYFFDNSLESPKLFNHFKKDKTVKKWDHTESLNFPNWFIEYYLNKVNSS